MFIFEHICTRGDMGAPNPGYMGRFFNWHSIFPLTSFKPKSEDKRDSGRR